MNRFIQSIVLATSLTAVATASAQSSDTVVATFAYSPGHNTESTYAQFEVTARRACAITHSQAGGFSAKWQAERTCRADLVDRAVRATQDIDLLSLHAERTGKSTPRLLAVQR
ncbi:MAG: hypothetical protein AAGG11_08695 [Pseudomonadota bacterium]